jgi:hypothetical protein
MSLVPLTQQKINEAIVNDATYLRSMIEWANRRYDAYNAMLTTDAMNAASIPSEDQAYILAFIGDLNRIITLAGGTVPQNADDMLYNITHLLGLNS